MRDEPTPPLALRWWSTLERPERIVAMSLATGGIVAITCSTVWAAAASFISYQRARATIARAELHRTEALEPLEAPSAIVGGAQ